MASQSAARCTPAESPYIDLDRSLQCLTCEHLLNDLPIVTAPINRHTLAAKCQKKCHYLYPRAFRHISCHKCSPAGTSTAHTNPLEKWQRCPPVGEAQRSQHALVSTHCGWPATQPQDRLPFGPGSSLSRAPPPGCTVHGVTELQLPPTQFTWVTPVTAFTTTSERQPSTAPTRAKMVLELQQTAAARNKRQMR